MDCRSFTLQIRHAADAGDLERVRPLLRAYTAFLASCTAPGEVDLESRLAELDDLPGTNAPPRGALLLALVDGEPAGCVAVGPMVLVSNETVAELRRMWVSPHFRGHGLGRSLVEEAISRARAAGYSAVYLDCLQTVMPAAMNIYRALGFEPVARYKHDHSVEEAAYLRLDLSRPV